MKNPWTKKNPLLSMWLSGANAVGGAARGIATAEAKRQGTAMVNKSTQAWMDLWTGASLAPPAAKKRKRRTR